MTLVSCLVVLPKFPCSSFTFMCFANNLRTLQSPLNAVIDLAIKTLKKEMQASELGLDHTGEKQN